MSRFRNAAAAATLTVLSAVSVISAQSLAEKVKLQKLLSLYAGDESLFTMFLNKNEAADEASQRSADSLLLKRVYADSVAAAAKQDSLVQAKKAVLESAREELNAIIEKNPKLTAMRFDQLSSSTMTKLRNAGYIVAKRKSAPHLSSVDSYDEASALASLEFAKEMEKRVSGMTERLAGSIEKNRREGLGKSIAVTNENGETVSNDTNAVISQDGKVNITKFMNGVKSKVNTTTLQGAFVFFDNTFETKDKFGDLAYETVIFQMIPAEALAASTELSADGVVLTELNRFITGLGKSFDIASKTLPSQASILKQALGAVGVAETVGKAVGNAVK